MKYLFLLFHEEREDLSSPEQMAAWGVFEEIAKGQGAKVAGAALHSSTTASTVSIRNEEILVTDGPFADTKEQFGGFYVMECADLDQAIELATQVPWARTGHIEVRPIINFSVEE